MSAVGRVLTASLLALLVMPHGAVLAPFAQGQPFSPRTVVDMAGRTVLVPASLRKVATLGSAPVLNSFVLALGKGETLANSLPANVKGGQEKGSTFQEDCCRFQTVFAPGLATQPCVEGADYALNSEALAGLRPDLVITAHRPYVDLIERTNIPVLYVGLDARGNTNKEIMAVLGKAYGVEERAEEYTRYFDSVIQRVHSRTSEVQEKERPRVLYCNFRFMTQSSLTADWWIEEAGGKSVTRGGRWVGSSFTFSPEHVLRWDPDVWIVSVPREIEMVLRDSRFTTVKAVRDKRVLSVPVGSIRWSHPTSEQPLGVLWAAKLLYPSRFKDLNLEEEMRYFYRTFFRYRLTDDELKEMLTGKKPGGHST